MTQKQDGGPAFPVERGSDWAKGMTLRDYFAGQALVGLMSYRGFCAKAKTARLVYEMADALLAERDGEKPEPDNAVHFTFAGR